MPQERGVDRGSVPGVPVLRLFLLVGFRLAPCAFPLIGQVRRPAHAPGHQRQKGPAHHQGDHIHHELGRVHGQKGQRDQGEDEDEDAEVESNASENGFHAGILSAR